MKNAYRFFFLLFCSTLTIFAFGQNKNLNLDRSYQLRAERSELIFSTSQAADSMSVQLNGTVHTLPIAQGAARLGITLSQRGELLLLQHEGKGYRLYHLSARNDGTPRLRRVPMWLSVVPPLIAILLALIFKEVIISLFVGVWVGAFIAGGMRIESLYYFMLSLFDVVERYVIQALADTGHLAIIVFSSLIGGMVAIISRNGGMAGVVLAFSRYARSPRSAQFITWLLGVAIFFDDYANTLIVGNTMRSVTDKFRVSREKLAYIVDSTAAPVAAVAFITTWIGAELGYIDDGLLQITEKTGTDLGLTPYGVFISSLKYSFYPVMTLAFILMLVYTRRDFGGMYTAEKRARETGELFTKRSAAAEEDMENLDPVADAPLKWYNAAIPVFLVILITIYGLIDTGLAATYGEMLEAGLAPASQSWGAVWGSISALPDVGDSFLIKVGKLIGNADSYVALLWASLSGVIAAILLTVGGRIMGLADAISTMITGFKAMLPAILILTMAWSLAATTEELHTATFLTSVLQDSINPFAMPILIFVLAAVISFSTGSSWSTMAILYPIAIPTTWAICMAQGVETEVAMELLFNVISTTLAASVLGDHCSPISDTTILSSLASDCNHIDHVRTQLPYALTVGAVALVAGGLSTFLGGGWGICLLLLLAGLVVLFGIVRGFGKIVDQ
ncbi:MAG: Na+/H+ antiporter NhaC family protein [Phaeodactylibacter sp.]|uniref:Na+/H+ antiporter NhaC family protein n=1 Tax=Phaeodactylibacter sp. TaxID=1940289 RepID=UPI0032EFCDBC